MLESPFPKDLCKKLGLPAGSTWAEAISEVHFRTALRGNETGNAARREIADRVEGKSSQRFEIATPEGGWEVKISFEEPIKRSIEPPIDVKPELPPGEPSES